MPTLLQIDSSPMGEDSISRRLTREFVQEWLGANLQGELLYRDVTQLPIPVIDASWDRANRTPKHLRTQEQNDVLALSTILTSDLLKADEYVLGIPMHNLGPSASFKLWIDQIVRFGETVVLTPAGPRGALGDKRITFILSIGGIVRPGSPCAFRNYLEPWLRTMFGYLGIQQMHFILADGAADVKNGKLDREVFLAPHIDAIHSLVADVAGR